MVFPPSLLSEVFFLFAFFLLPFLYDLEKTITHAHESLGWKISASMLLSTTPPTTCVHSFKLLD